MSIVNIGRNIAKGVIGDFNRFRSNNLSHNKHKVYILQLLYYFIFTFHILYKGLVQQYLYDRVLVVYLHHLATPNFTLLNEHYSHYW